MKITPTGIAVALALVVVAVFFILPGLWPFGGMNAAVITADDQNTDTTMPTPNTDQFSAADLQVGTGATAEPGDTVTVNYVGALSTGQVFDASANHGDQGFTFVLGAGEVIPGWDQGIVGMRVGGARRLVIPPALAYGSQAVGGVIPANSTLIFEVQLVKVEKAQR